MSDEDEKLSEERRELLKIEYQQVSEAFRNHGILLHRSYYLSAVVFTFLLGAIVTLVDSEAFLLASGVSVIGSISFALLGFGATAYHRRRENLISWRDDIKSDLTVNIEEDTLELQAAISGGESKKDIERYLDKLPVLMYLTAFLFFSTAVVFLLLSFNLICLPG